MHRVLRGALCVVLFGSAAACASSPPDEPADLILTGGEIYTPDGWVDALAVRDGAIVALGGERSVHRLSGVDTKLVELDGATVFPGLHDGHVHPALGGREQLQPCQIPYEPASAILDAVSACASATAPGEWIATGPIGGAVFELNRLDLDAAAPANPVMIYAAGTHTVVVNSAALALAGIDRSTEAPPNGIIERDAEGEPTGILVDAANPVWAAVPPPDPALVAQGLAWGLDQLLSVGVTSITDASLGRVETLAYIDLAEAGLLKTRVLGCLSWAPELGVPFYVGAPELLGRDRFTPRCVKIFLDGASDGTMTAALLEPYQPADGSTTVERGELAMPVEELSAIVVALDAAGLTAKFHAWGDAAVEEAVTAVKAARAANGPNGPRHVVGHVVLARFEDIERAKAAGAVLEFSPWLWFPPAGPHMFEQIGEVRAARAWPVRDALDVGALVVGGTDWATAPGHSPWGAIETLVTRLEPTALDAPLYRFGPPSDGDEEPFAPGQRITLEEAIAIFTTTPGELAGDPGAPGAIEVGRPADLVILDRNPFEIPITEVHAVTAVVTIIGGEVVYEAASAK